MVVKFGGGLFLFWGGPSREGEPSVQVERTSLVDEDVVGKEKKLKWKTKKGGPLTQRCMLR